ncbi:uncharacterized protein LOC110831470 isoform X2 [Zootermopsis nevadensis]|uniref:uncharacterized protein LOC110831470 isoform X2 n=1 Tax=Zootermopsis nevadensis TaxID=136037 RepID=UPI000B8EAC47|nr:uncharacterized protein LOC110831470 isoform X2 [Zootermopsis nevadensis]
MEIMEEGNMMDRVRILLQRDMAYYQAHQTVLQENLCPGVVGGLLDFPHYASFAAVKLVAWWEEEYVATFHCASGLLEHSSDDPMGQRESEDLDRGCGGIAVTKTSVPTEFVSLVADSSKQLLEHLHTLSQEALDHADLTVLTGTLGAAALIRNCLWCYNEKLKNKEQTQSKQTAMLSLQGSYRKYHEMAEALAERLLDLHCRLLSLYVLQDADCLHWEDPHPFFEGERGSFVIQMWWLYMQGTREDLWKTVPPKMAQRVLAGMLNESLTILTVRYTQAIPSSGRSLLLVTDVSNLLLCVRQILPSICSDASELIGRNLRNKVLRDVHAKCYELLVCLILRGSPLSALYKVFRRGLNEVAIFSPLDSSAPAPWLVLTSPHLFPVHQSTNSNLPDGSAIALELSLLVAQPQASWPLLLKVLTMRHYRVTCIILQHFMQHFWNVTIQPACHNVKDAKDTQEQKGEAKQCGGFLCGGRGNCSLGGNVSEQHLPPSVIISSLVYIVAVVGTQHDLAHVLVPVLEKNSDSWGCCLDRRQVWNQSRPPWLEAVISPLEPVLFPVVETLSVTFAGGCSLDQGIDVVMDCLIQLSDCLPSLVLRAAAVLEDAIPADIHPLANSVLLQLVVAALYSQLLATGGNTSATALAEALCSLDHSGQHNSKIDAFIHAAVECAQISSQDGNCVTMEASPYTAEILVSRLLLNAAGQRALKVMWQFMQHSWQWLLGQLGALEPGEVTPSTPPLVPTTASRPALTKLLHTMFHVGHRQFDQGLGSWTGTDCFKLLSHSHQNVYGISCQAVQSFMNHHQVC